jgi:hypothetical protein
LEGEEIVDTTTIVIILLALVVIALVAVILLQRRRSQHLQSRFGPEYERTVHQSGDKRKAEAELLEREKRVEKLSIRPLQPKERERFTDEWRRIQAEFVDNPEGSMSHADTLVQEVMGARGYPVRDFEQAAADISVDHPKVVQHYRTGHDIAVRHQRGEASTEDLRQAMIHYRDLFEELVHDEEVAGGKSNSKSRRSADVTARR